MGTVNKVILLGRLGKDPETKHSQGGMLICRFSLATSKKKKDGSEVTEWHRCLCFDKKAEIISQYMAKGSEIYIEGELQYGNYQDKDNITVYTTDIIVNQFTFVGSKNDKQNQNYNQSQQNTGQPVNQNYSNQGNQSPPDSEIPF